MTNEQLAIKIESLEEAIRDSFHRMATNRDGLYRAQQMKKVIGWLEELTVLHETYLEQWITLDS